MADKPRDTITYELVNGRKVVYRGTTSQNPEQRAKQHQGEGKQFTNIRVTSRKMTEEGAKKKEEASLATYRQNHSGRNPRYNKNKTG